MKKTIATSLLAAVAMAANAAPLVTVGDQLDIFFRGAVMGSYNSNVTYASKSEHKIDDYAGTLRLGAEADYGRNSKFKANIKFNEDFTKYVDHKSLDRNTAHLAANASYTESNWNASSYFKYDQYAQNSSDIDATMRNEGKLVDYNYWAAGAKGQYDFTEKVFATIGFDWAELEYTRGYQDEYTSYSMYSVPLSVYYRATQKISVGLTYMYRYMDMFDGRARNILLYGDDRVDNFVGVTVLGEIAPKLNCELYFGATNRTYDTVAYGYQDDWTMSGRITLNYEVSDKMGVYVKAARDFGGSANAQSTTYTFGEAGVNYFFNAKIIGTASMQYRDTSYELQDRSDETIWTRVGVSYNPNKFIKLALNYNYINNSSDTASANYNQHMVSLEASLRY